jgi:hypothetical protein
MRILYKYGRLVLPLWIPNSLVKSKRIQKAIHIDKYNEFINVALIECKNYVRKCGHFTIIDLKTQDEDKDILIKIKL